MAEQSERGSYQFHCPLCDHAQEMTAKTEELCPYCGAQLHLFDDPQQAGNFATELKQAGQSVRWRRVINAPFWVVGHKSTPTAMAA
ncbi:MAG: hypothetical protein ACYC7E_00965 [Armatimonadota bacterium]